MNLLMWYSPAAWQKNISVMKTRLANTCRLVATTCESPTATWNDSLLSMILPEPAVTPGTVAHRVAQVPAGARKTFSVQHPTGEFTVVLEMSAANPAEVARASLLRTARLLMRGEVFIPGNTWPGQ